MAALMAAAMGTPALAAAAEPAASDGTPGDIVVTARKSSEKLQDVPLSIAAVTAADMQVRGSADLQDVANYTPGLRFTDFLSKFNGNAVIRGLSQANVQSAIGNTGVFLDGVYLQRGYMVDSQLGDIERIEVVKGPQSALYGQNTFSGAINYVLRQPTNRLKIDGQASIGNGGYKDVRLGIGGPIIKDLLMARVYYANASFDGVWKNNFAGAGTSDLAHFGGYKRENFSASVKLTPAPGLTILGSYYKLTRTEKIRAFYTIDGNLKEDGLNCGRTGANGSKYLWCGNLPNSPAGKHTGVNSANYPDGLFAAPQPGMYGSTELWHGSIKYDFAPAWSFNYDFGDARGVGIEQSIFASNSYYLDANSYRLSTATVGVSRQREAGLLKYQSHDARISYDNRGPLKFDFGYFHSKAWDSFLFGNRTGQAAGVAWLSDDLNPLSAGGMNLFNNRLTEYWTDSVFGRASYGLLDNRLTLSAEARYSHTVLRTVDRLALTRPPLRAAYNNITPRFSLEFKQSPGLMFYASAAKGVKNGGFNGYVTGTVSLLESERSFGEEVNWTYEIGTKGSLLNNRLIYALSLFYIDWQKRQISATPANYVVTTVTAAVPGIYVSGGAARSMGVELSATYKVTPKLTVNGSFAWQDARASNGAINPTTSSYCDDVVCASSGNVAGNFLGNVPWLQGTLGADYRQPLGNGLTLFAGVDEVFRGKLYTDTTNTASIAPYALTNGRIGVEGGTWKAFIWGKNLLDHQYAESSFVVPSIYQYNVSMGDRRTFGATVTFNY
ncbi:TonB-dependent receptor [Novosphingobium sp. FSY-8]|uniref:TonB-dependent receptor n=1 Tax=Novosphingobium ovatum TaxID=1908523 RepID=A0ABW9XI87_9SPHN|nr:TonB-dependent receptor [Novosphingobium ovatum]NBC38164.1 TonB-dependent receptor [Novosphingobium ovatum]